MSTKKQLTEIIKALKNYMQLEKESGMEEFLLQRAAEPITASQKAQTVYPDKKKALEGLNRKARLCRECPLAKDRRHVVFGEGSPDARLMFVGEAPGLEEDIHGRPFVGRAGKLLTKIIEAIDLKREDVYIGNCLKCRPPKNRTPLPSEIAACRHFLQKQIEIIHPEVICCLGRPAAQTLLVSDLPIGKLRGKFYDYNGIKVMPTFHPAYLLRNPADKKLAWEDMKKVRDALAGK